LPPGDLLNPMNINLLMLMFVPEAHIASMVCKERRRKTEYKEEGTYISNEAGEPQSSSRWVRAYGSGGRWEEGRVKVDGKGKGLYTQETQ
jgi:hypothetical protein